jgi:hypothetical protein
MSHTIKGMAVYILGMITGMLIGFPPFLQFSN